MKRVMKKKKGFTLMELLIVIAIIVVLVAISIPVFKGQITKANETADVADIRSCYAEHQEEILTSGETIATAVAAVNALDLNYPDNLGGSEGMITYTAHVIKSNGTNVFTWEFKTADIE